MAPADADAVGGTRTSADNSVPVAADAALTLATPAQQKKKKKRKKSVKRKAT